MKKNLFYTFCVLLCSFLCLGTMDAQTIIFSDDFEAPSPDGLLPNGWSITDNVLDANLGFQGNNGTFPANAVGGAGSNLAPDPSGASTQVLNVFPNFDFGSGIHNTGCPLSGVPTQFLQTHIFQAYVVPADFAGATLDFTFDYLLNGFMADPNAPSVEAFITVFDSNFGFIRTEGFDVSNATAAAQQGALSFTADDTAEGNNLQFGFRSTSTCFQQTSIFYDNVEFTGPSPVVVDVVPTMGEWGVICLSLGMMIFGVVAIRREDVVLG